MPFQKGHKLSIGRPKGKSNKLTRKSKKFLRDLSYDHASMEEDWNRLNLHERMTF